MYYKSFNGCPFRVEGDMFGLKEFGFAYPSFWNQVGSGPDAKAWLPKDTWTELTVDNDLLL